MTTKFRIDGFPPGYEVHVLAGHDVVVASAARPVASQKAGADGSVAFDLGPGAYTALAGDVRIHFTVLGPDGRHPADPEPVEPESVPQVVHETPRDEQPVDRVLGARSVADKPKPKRTVRAAPKAKKAAAKKGK